jgi:hypothetical protein
VEEPPQRERAPGGEERATVTLAFASAVLGRLDLRLDVTAGRVEASVTAPAGGACELAEARAGRLRDGLAARTGLTAGVRVLPRREPLDVYA